MAISDARKKANQKWDAANLDRVSLAMPKGKREEIKAAAGEAGESMNQYIIGAVDMRMTGTAQSLPRDGVKLAGDAPGGSGDILTPEALKAAAEAAELAGESVPACVGRAVATLAEQDAKRRIFERDLAKAKAPDIFRDLTDT